MTGLHLETAEPFMEAATICSCNVESVHVTRRRMNVCVLRHNLAGHQAFGIQLRLQAISFNGLWHIFPCMHPSLNSDFSQQLLVDCFVVKARARVLQLSVITSWELSILPPSMQTADKEIWMSWCGDIHYSSESRVDALYHRHSFVGGDNLWTSVPILCTDNLIRYPFDNEIHN